MAYRIDLTPNASYTETVSVSQDDVGREIVVDLYKDGTAYTPTTGTTITMQGTKPSGLGYTITGTASGSTITFLTTEEMTQEAGRFASEIVLTNGDTVIGTANFALYVEKNPHPSNTIDGTGETMQTLTARIDALEDRVEDIEQGGGGLTELDDVDITSPVNGQVLTYDSSAAKWVNKVGAAPTDAQVGEAVADWLSDHPEATTTVQDGSITEAKLATDVLELIASSSAIDAYPSKYFNIGELFAQPETYLAWFQGCLKYDADIRCPVGVISGKDAHTTGSGKCYFIKFDPMTGAVSLSVAGQYDDADTYGCFSQSFYIDGHGNYNFYASIHESSGWSEISARKYTSTNKGETWTYAEVANGTVTPQGSVILLESGRLIGLKAVGSSTRSRVVYSDDDGETWTEGYSFASYCTEVEIIELTDALIAIGRKALTYSAALPAVLFYSTNDGETWTGGLDSTTITDMCNPCSGVYWKDTKFLELYYCSRYGNNNTGTIYHAWATLEDALTDNFTVEAIGESKQTSVGIDFGYCAAVCDQQRRAWTIYYDSADSGSGTNLNLILSDREIVSLPVSDTSTLLTAYSSKAVDAKIASLRSELMVKINEIIISGGGTVPDEGDGSMYIMDGLFAYYNFGIDHYDPTTSKYTPVVGSGDGLVVTAYNNNTGIGAGHTADDSGMIYIDTQNFTSASSDFTIEFVLQKSSKAAKTNILALNTAINFYNTSLVLQGNAISGSLVSSTTYIDSAANYILPSANNNVHVFIVYDSTNNKVDVYKNNVLVVSATGNSTALKSYLTSQDGIWLSARIYSKALNAEERQNNYTYYTTYEFA